MTHSLRRVSFVLPLALALASCTKPSNEQIVKMIQENPSILAEAIKKNPSAFRDALNAAQEYMRKEQAREQQEKVQKEQDAAFATPLEPKLTDQQVYEGPAKAKVVIVEYTDLECPYCARGNQTMKEVLKKYKDDVKLTIKHLPLPMHTHAQPAAYYYEAIRLQNPKAAIQFADAIFSHQAELRQNGEKALDDEAKKLGIKLPKLKADIQTDAVKKKVEADTAEAKTFGFTGTPSFLVNGVPVRGAYPVEEFARIIDRHLQKK